MDININNKPASSFRRSSASSIDMIIVLCLRILSAQIMGIIWINKVAGQFLTEFQEKFGTEFIKNDPDHMQFVLHHKALYHIIIFYVVIILVGAIYHAYLNSSLWQATIGKRTMKIIMVNEDQQKISFGLGMAHYFLSVLPFIYLFYIVGYQATHHLSLFQAITATPVNVFFGFVFIFWVQIHIFTKKKITAYDLICKTKVIEGKTSAKYPWR